MKTKSDAAENFGSAVCYTPGPWERYGYIGQPGLTRVRACIGTDRTGRKQFVDVPDSSDDAKLIAAAPELLEALQHCVRWHDQLSVSDIEKAKAAIAKAIGA